MKTLPFHPEGSAGRELPDGAVRGESHPVGVTSRLVAAMLERRTV